MEDGWRVGGREGGKEGLIGNRLATSKLEPWLQLVETFACYPGPRLVHDVVPPGEDGVIPMWEVPGWEVLADLSVLRGENVASRLQLRDLCRTRPDWKNWNAVTESKRVGSGEIMTTLTGVRSDMFVEETATGQVGILRETWWDAEDEGWVGAVKWLAGKLVSERRSTGWTKFKEEGVSWPCVLPNFERWSWVNCGRLRPIWAYRERPLTRRPGLGSGCLWV